jgi:hypothetical protein
MTARIGLKPLATVAVTAAPAVGLLSGVGPAIGSAPTPDGTVTAAGAMSASAAASAVQMAEPSSARAGPPLPGKLVALVVLGVLFAVFWAAMKVIEFSKRARRWLRGGPGPDEDKVTAHALASLRDGKENEDESSHVADPVARTL